MQKLDPKYYETLLANTQVYRPKLIASSNPIRSKRQMVEQALLDNQDVIDPLWEKRHAKLVYQIGYDAYEQLAITARKKTSPRGYMAWLVNKELGK